MSEADWLTAPDPVVLMEFLRGRTSDRKLRLLACACCRHVWHLLDDARSRRAVEVAELYADGNAGGADLLAAAADANEATYPEDLPAAGVNRSARRAAHLAAYAPHAADAFLAPPARVRPGYGGVRAGGVGGTGRVRRAGVHLRRPGGPRLGPGAVE